MTPWGLLIVVLLLAALLTDPPRWMPWLLSLTLALPKTAALIAGPFPLGGFQLVSLACAPLLLHHLATRGVPPAMKQPATWGLFGLLGWAASVTALSPTLFYGTTIFTSQVENSEGLVVEAPLTYTSSNLAQVGYLGLLIVVVLSLCPLPRLDPRVLLPGLAVGIFLSTWRLAADRAGVPFPAELIDRSTYLYVDLTGDGTYRLRGVFTEPSVLALYALAALALCLVLALALRGASASTRWVAAGVALLAVVNLVFSRSGTGVVAGGLLLVLAVPALLGAGGRSRAIGPIAIGMCGMAALALVMHRQVLDYAGGIVGTKVGSTSYTARTQSDLEALTGIGDTFGLGVGLGSTRSSSLWPYLFASIGPVGTALFAAVVVMAVVGAWRNPAWHGAAAVLVATVVTKSIAGSAPFEPLLVLALAVCLAGPRVGATERPRPRVEDTADLRGFSTSRSRSSSEDRALLT